MNEGCKHVFLTGRVQGVGFRAFVRRNARRLDLQGWVKNLPDGRVEAMISGPEEEVEELLELMKEGPSLARVADISVSSCEDCNFSGNFEIKY